jgi:AcrR family transcriptional regulator
MPKIVNHDEYKQVLLEKSLSFFSQKGYSNINMKQIAARISVSTGTLYHYFPSKENMLENMIVYFVDKNVEEYIHRTSSIESISDCFDMIMDYWKEKRAIYKTIILLSIDAYRNLDNERWKAFYCLFAERYTDKMSERLNISQQFALSIFTYFIGLSFLSLAFDGPNEYDKQIDFLNTIYRPLIVDAAGNMETSAQNFKKISGTFFMNGFTAKKTAIGKKHKINNSPKVILNSDYG